MTHVLHTYGRRASSAALGVALLCGALMVGAAPASATEAEIDGASEVDGTVEGNGAAESEDDAYHLVSGTVSLLDAAGSSSTAGGIQVTLRSPYESPSIEATAADGSFSFHSLEDGDYSIGVANPGSDVYAPESVEFTVDGGDVVLDPIVLKTYLAEGTMSVSGDTVVGQTLTITTSGWPAGVTLSYQWGSSGGNYGGPIDGATSSTLTLTDAQFGQMISAFVTAEKTGFAPTTISVFTDGVVSMPKKPAATAPVGSSAGLVAYLAGKGSTPQSAESVGLPAGALNPANGYQGTVSWTAADSFVDVYAYSTPVLVGTFPVVDGVVRFDLSAELLSRLGAGEHTLVILGQSSGAVTSANLSVAAVLAATGVDVVPALSGGALFLLLGALCLVAARRRRARA